MIVEIERHYRYDPERVKNAKRLYNEAITELVLKELEKIKSTNINEKDNSNKDQKEAIG